jgi:hypothetical protein
MYFRSSSSRSRLTRGGDASGGGQPFHEGTQLQGDVVEGDAMVATCRRMAKLLKSMVNANINCFYN